MRTYEPEPEPLQPLGEKVHPVPRTQPRPTIWEQHPCAPSIIVGDDGKLRTNLPLPKWEQPICGGAPEVW